MLGVYVIRSSLVSARLRTARFDMHEVVDMHEVDDMHEVGIGSYSISFMIVTAIIYASEHRSLM